MSTPTPRFRAVLIPRRPDEYRRLADGHLELLARGAGTYWPEQEWMARELLDLRAKVPDLVEALRMLRMRDDAPPDGADCWCPTYSAIGHTQECLRAARALAEYDEAQKP